MGENSFLINCIQKIYSGKIPIDRTEVSIRSNKTTNALIQKNVQFLQRNGFPKVASWAVSIAGQLALSEMTTNKINPAMVELIQELEETKAKLVKSQESETKWHASFVTMYNKYKKLENSMVRKQFAV